MKIKPDLTTGSVHIILSAKEALRFSQQLVKAAIRSTPGQDWTTPLTNNGNKEPEE